MTTHERRRPALLAPALAFLAIVVLVLLSVVSCGAARSDVGGTGFVQAPVGLQQGFDISGSATAALSPGGSAPIDVRIRNTEDQTLRVSDLRVTVASVDAPFASAELPCTVDDFAILQADRTIEIRPDTSLAFSELDWPESDWPHVTMLDTDANQDGCIDAELRLTFHATGGFTP